MLRQGYGENSVNWAEGMHAICHMCTCGVQINHQHVGTNGNDVVHNVDAKHKICDDC